MRRLGRAGVIVACVVGAGTARAAEALRFRQQCLRDLTAAVPGIMQSQEARTGRFSSGVWIVSDQNVILPLAVAWATRDAANPYYHRDEILRAIMAGGDALIDDQDAAGQWVFRKKDGSTWGKIHMPWTYSRWIRTYGLIRDAMPPERRQRWEKALRLGYGNIAQKALGSVHNIPSHHAMGLHFAGRLLGEPAWEKKAAEFLRKVAAAQHRDGYWSEHMGPVVQYNYVYVDALGTYYIETRDAAVLPALERASQFHRRFTYPDGTPVETIDERTPYDADVKLPNPGFTITAEGRAFVAILLRAWGSRPLPADVAALLLLHGLEGPASGDTGAGQDRFLLGEGDAAVWRRGPWFLVASAMVCPVVPNRWIQDRQNLVSVFHERTGLILGGGNTKLQPRWSTFTVGDPEMLRHKAGDENPSFIPPTGILHVPTKAALVEQETSDTGSSRIGLALEYGRQRCGVTMTAIDQATLELVYSVVGPCEAPVAAHITLLPRIGQPVRTAAGREVRLGHEAFLWRSSDVGGWIEHAALRIESPATAQVRWPVLPHNPYRKDGRAEPGEGRLVVDLPFPGEGGTQKVVLRVAAGEK